MKKLLPILLLSLCGCATTNITEMTKALSKDNAHVHIEVRSPWGTVTFDREMPNPYGTNVVTTSTAILRH